MLISNYSVIMGILWFTIALLVGSFLIMRGKKVRRELFSLIFLLGFIRLLLPIEFWSTKEVYDWYIYPSVQQVWRIEPMQGISLATIFFWVWGIGSCVEFIIFGRKLWILHEMTHRARTILPEDRTYSICSEAARQLNYKGQFKVAVTQELSTAVSAGFFNPVILIPNAMQDFAEEELIGIFKHELMHYLRKDLRVQWAMNLLQCLFWWNPVVYFVKRSMEQMIELRCDEMVCRDMNDEEKVIYLQGITHALRIPGKKPELGIGYAKNNSSIFLQRRFQEVLTPVKKQSRSVTVVLAAICAAVFIFSYSFSVFPGSFPDESEVQGLNETSDSEDVQNFLLKLSDGTYIYFKNMLQEDILTEEEIQQLEYINLPIYEEFEGE